MQLTQDDLARISAGNVISTSGDKIGGIGQIYVDDATGQPAWVTVKTGLFGTSESFVPLEGASLAGDDIQVAYDKDVIKNAPRVEADGKISREEEDQLYAYYNVGSAGTGVDGDRRSGGDVNGVGAGTTGADYADTASGDGYTDNTRGTDYAESTRGTDHADTGRGTDFADTGRRDLDDSASRGTVGHDTSGPNTDDAMTLSEEQLRVGTQPRRPAAPGCGSTWSPRT